MLANKITNVMHNKIGAMPSQLPQRMRNTCLTSQSAHRESLTDHYVYFCFISNLIISLYQTKTSRVFSSYFFNRIPPFLTVPRGVVLGRKSTSFRVDASDSQGAAPTDAEEIGDEFVSTTPTEQNSETVTADAISTAAEADSELSGAYALPEPSVGIATPQPSGPLSTVNTFLKATPVAYWSLIGIGGFLAGTFVIALFRSAAKGFTSQGKRTRTVNKNKLVVEEFSKYLPANREGLTGAVVTGIRLRTGFSPVELFRKYLWYLLRERKFDEQAVDDLTILKSALGLNDAQVAEALKERANRVYDKYGNVMLDTSGMSPAGIERKATSRALFSKLLFLVENEALVSPEEAAGVNLRDIFGATEDDASRLRIASLYEVDLEAAMGLPSAQEGNDGQEGQ